MCHWGNGGGEDKAVFVFQLLRSVTSILCSLLLNKQNNPDTQGEQIYVKNHWMGYHGILPVNLLKACVMPLDAAAAAASRRAETAESFAQRHQVPSAHSSYEALVKSEVMPFASQPHIPCIMKTPCFA